MSPNNPPYEPGQIVVYKSGGGQMTVERCIPAEQIPRKWDGANNEPEKWLSDWGVKVVWLQDDGVPHERIVDPALIKLYKSDYELVHEAFERAIEDGASKDHH